MDNKITWMPITPIPDEAPEKPTYFISKKKPISHYYTYFTKQNEIAGYTCLVKLPDGGKEIIPLTYCRSDKGEESWRFKSFDTPRPIYGIEKLIAKPYAQVLIVEGEKCADAGNMIFKDVENMVVISWIGGYQSVKKTEWIFLKNRKLILWPDADSQRYADNHGKAGELKPFVEQPGADAMIKIYNIVKKYAADARLVKPPKDKINGWDIADAVGLKWSKDKIIEFIKKNLIKFEDISQKPKIESNGVARPFMCLGYNSYGGNVTYYYLPVGTKKVTALSANSHTKMNLLSIAPVQFFEREYIRGMTADFTAAANDCMRQCEKIGIYDPLRVRGRGAWFDNGRTVLHLGNKLIVDGKSCKIDNIKSYYIYEAEIPTEGTNGFMNEILTNEESKKIINICDMLSWHDKISSKLFAGWIMLAPICGAIEWRPHIWITGESSTGKTWIQDNIISQILGKTVLNASSNSTEAGIRQSLKNDAFPVRFDEVETEDKESMSRVQRIIELARQSSSNKSASIIKGTISGKAQSYCIRSCFLFSSINPKLCQQADESRITILKLVKRKDYEDGNKFDDLRDFVIDTLTENYCSKLRARAIKLIPVIRENINIFSVIMSKKLKSKRQGDQIGSLLAGAYAIVSDEIISIDKAQAWADSVNWEKETNVYEKSDHEKCIEVILQQLIKNETNNRFEAVGDLLSQAGKIADSHTSEEGRHQIELDRRIARDTLRKYGITTIKNKNTGYFDIGIAENHSLLKKLLENTPWHNGYKLTLGRFKDAVVKTAVFADKTRSAAIIVPFKTIFKEDIEDEEEMF